MLQNNPGIKSLIDRLWDRFWSGGIANPMTAIEQITYLLFMKRIDDLDQKRMRDSEFTGKPYTSIFKGIFQPPNSNEKIKKETLRWGHFKRMNADDMLLHVQVRVFPFLKGMNGEASSFTHEKKYIDILREGFRKNPIVKQRMIKKRGRPGKTKIQNLPVRLRDYRNEVLAFMYDIDVPFDNNLAERDLRMIKVQQKVSGLFRTMAGAEQFCKIRSFISTVRKQGLNVIDSIYQIMTGSQIYLNFAS